MKNINGGKVITSLEHVPTPIYRCVRPDAELITVTTEVVGNSRSQYSREAERYSLAIPQYPDSEKCLDTLKFRQSTSSTRFLVSCKGFSDTKKRATARPPLPTSAAS
ncbi:hypothetical protein TRVL_00124 [Trypanosoma vivax]|nr:hypothetical protein TRVL_00124 [Trypanosoma vivax]